MTMTTKGKKKKRRIIGHLSSRDTSNTSSSGSSIKCSPKNYTFASDCSSRILQCKPHTVIIFGIPASVIKTDILQYFGKFGTICQCIVDPKNPLSSSHRMDKETRIPNSIQHSSVCITFTNKKSADLAVNGAGNFKLNNKAKYAVAKNEYLIKAKHVTSTSFCECFKGRVCKSVNCVFFNGQTQDNEENQDINHEIQMKASVSSVVKKFTTKESDSDSSLSNIEEREQCKGARKPEIPIMMETSISPEILEQSSISLFSSDDDHLTLGDDEDPTQDLLNPSREPKMGRFLSVGENWRSQDIQTPLVGFNSPWQMRSPIMIAKEEDSTHSMFRSITFHPESKNNSLSVLSNENNCAIMTRRIGPNASKEETKSMSFYQNMSSNNKNQAEKNSICNILLKEKCNLNSNSISVQQHQRASTMKYPKSHTLKEQRRIIQTPKFRTTVNIPSTLTPNTSLLVKNQIEQPARPLECFVYPTTENASYATNPHHDRYSDFYLSHQSFQQQQHLINHNHCGGLMIPNGIQSFTSHQIHHHIGFHTPYRPEFHYTYPGYYYSHNPPFHHHLPMHSGWN